MRLNKILRELDITTSFAADVLANKGHLIDPKPTTKLTEQQVELLRNEISKANIKLTASIDFEIGNHYEFEIKENREYFTIVNTIGHPEDTYTSERIYQQPGDKVKLFVKKFKDNGEPVLIFSVLNSYKLYHNYVFNVTPTPSENGYLLENNEYHEHFVPPMFKPLIEDGLIELKVSGFDEGSNRLLFDDSSLKKTQLFSSNGHSALLNGEDYKFKVLGLKEDYNGDKNLIGLEYEGEEYTTKAFDFQKEYGLPKWLYCTVNKDQNLRLYQNFIKSFNEIFDIQKPYTFTIIDERIDQNDASYFVVKDKVGYIHRFYKNDTPIDVPPTVGEQIELFVADINEQGKHLKLDWYIRELDVKREFYSPDRIFGNLPNYSLDEHLYNLQEFIDIELERLDSKGFKAPYLELFSQIENENNNWFFSYLSLLSQYNSNLIKQGKYDLAKEFIQLYIDLEEWLIDSDFITAYSKYKKQEIIDNAEDIAAKQVNLLSLINDLEDKKHYKSLEKIFSKLQKHGIISKRDLQKTIEYLKWDKTLLTVKYDLIYGIIHELLDHQNIESEDLYFLNQVTNQAYESTFASRNFVLTSGIQQLNDLEAEELEIENKHLFIQIRLNEALNWHNFAVMKSAELLRNLALLSTELPLKRKFLLHSIDIIAKEVALNTLSVDDFLNLNQISSKVEKALETEGLNESKLYFYKHSGVVINTSDGWLISNQFISFKENLECKETPAVLLSIYDGRIKLVTDQATKYKYQSLESYSTSFWGTYINNRKSFNENFEDFPPTKLSSRLHFLRSVIKSIDYLVSIEGDLYNKIEVLQFVKLITVILRDNKSFYYDELLRLYYRIIGLENNIDNEFFAQPVNSETLEKFPTLTVIQNIHSVINLIGSEDILALNSFLENENNTVRSITKMVVAYNSVMSEFPDHKEISRQLMSLIETTILNKVLFIESSSLNMNNDSDNSTREISKIKQFNINDGREDIVTEFKTSVVYHPGSSEPEIDKQASQIVKVITGFLNARGGKLYIGVKDNGVVVGLESDYKQLEVNSDGYERIIRKYIVRYTNTTINGLLDFEFSNEKSLEYLIIHIPTYENLVDFKGDFYQRQGTETRIIKGQDLTNLFQKKLNVQRKITEPILEERNQLELNLISEQSNVYDSNRITPSGSISRKEGIYNISIFEDRSWVWSDSGKDFEFGETINFRISNKNSYILICYSEGRLAKFRSRSFLSRNKNERQRNTFALRPDSEIVNIFEIEKDIDFLVQTSFAGETYLKIINSSEAGDVRNSLASQGTYFVDSNNDGVISITQINLDHLDCQQYSKLQMSKQTLGIVSTSDKIADLVEELRIKNYL